MSGSGTAVQGEHLIDPRTGGPAGRTRRLWSFADTAADADALSTAFFVMADDAIVSFCRQHPAYGAVFNRADGACHACGATGRPRALDG